MTLQPHPVAALFPLMEGEDFVALVADVKSNGLLQPIWLHRDGTILDGRNRYRACEESGIEAQFKTWTGPDSGIVQFVTSMNLHRRHLSIEQRAFIAAELANLTHGGNRKGDGIKLTNGQVDRPLVSRSEAASVMRVEPRALDRARAIVRHAPELKGKVISGEMSLTAAAKAAAENHARDEQRLLAREAARPANIERAKAALRKSREAKRVQMIAVAKRKLNAWLLAYRAETDLREAADLVKQAVAAIEKGAK